MSKKKLIFSLVVTSFSIVFCGTANFANASSVVEVCRLDAKIINVTEEHVFIDITGIKIFNKSSALCADININSDYKITRDNFLKNSYSESIFVDQNIIIDGVSGNAMGPNGLVYWDGWELESAGGKAIKLPITLEKMSVNVTVGDTDSLIGGNTYTIAELNTNTSVTPRKFFTEAYVVGIQKFVPCPKGANCVIIIPGISISDDKTPTNNNSAEVYTETFAKAESFIVGRKYSFEVSVQNANMSKTGIPPNNTFTLVSVKNIYGSVVAFETTTPPITDQPAKRSFFGRIWSWFAGLFKR